MSVARWNIVDPNVTDVTKVATERLNRHTSATTCRGNALRNALDPNATVCSEAANVPVNGWISGTTSGCLLASGSSLRAWLRAGSVTERVGDGL